MNILQNTQNIYKTHDDHEKIPENYRIHRNNMKINEKATQNQRAKTNTKKQRKRSRRKTRNRENEKTE